MANYNDWDRNRYGSGRDWNEDNYNDQDRNQRRRYGRSYGSDYGYNADRDRMREDYDRQNSGYNRNWEQGNRGSDSGRWDNDYNRNYPGGRDSMDINRNRGNDYGRGYGNDRDYDRGYGSDYDRRGWTHRGWGSDRDYENDRNWWDKTRDEVSSWFGDKDAEQRRRRDEREGPHRGRGPKGYTRSDDRIKEDINDKLNDDSNTDASEIEVNVTTGDVVLTGNVNSRHEKRRAEDLAESVSGVRNVENRIRVIQDKVAQVEGINPTGSTKSYKAQSNAGKFDTAGSHN